MTKHRWAILTGEYPPQLGGVSDYTRQTARGLAQAGDEVHVWAPASAGDAPTDPGVHVHHLPDQFGPRGLWELSADLQRLPGQVRILVQYVPHAFGWKAMNLPFAFWLLAGRRRPIWVMFHEVVFPWGRRHAFRQNLLGAVTRIMASVTAHAAQRVFVSIPAWENYLRPLAPAGQRIHWLPIPSSFPVEVDTAEVAAVRAQIAADPDAVLLGHFGTFGSHITDLLRPVLMSLLRADQRRAVLLLGHGAAAFASSLVNGAVDLAHRVYSLDGLPPSQLVTHLAACDLLIQPYPDGVSSRRTSLMSGLALGLPILTTEGPLSEPLWRESGAVALAPVDARGLVDVAETLLTDREWRRQLGERARVLYRGQFALEHTIQALRGESP